MDNRGISALINHVVRIKKGDCMENIVLYSNGCPKCRTLEQMLNKEHIGYTIDSDITHMIERGIQTVPVLQVNNETLLPFDEAIQWIRKKVAE